MSRVTEEEALRVERTGKELSNGHGLWGTIHDLDPQPGWSPAKRVALIEGWVEACRSFGLTDVDAAALGDYKIGRWYVDSASFWTEDAAPTVRRKGEEYAKKLIEGHMKNFGPSTIRGLKRHLVLEYTDYYPASPAYTRRIGG